MTDWHSLKVAELKEECKSRSIPLTGLKLKQHFVDKLIEYESNSQDATPAEDSQAKDEDNEIAERTHGAIEFEEKDEEPTTSNGTNGEHREKTEEEKLEEAVEDLPLAVTADANLPADRPATLKIEDSQASNVEEEMDMPMAKTRRESEQIQKNDIMIPQPEQLDIEKNAAVAEKRSASIQESKLETNGNTENAESIAQPAKESTPEPDLSMEHAQEKLQEDIKEAEPEETKIVQNGQVQEEQIDKKRKRSLTSSADTEEVYKKAKTAEDEATITRSSRSRSPSPQMQSKSPSLAASDIREVEPSLHTPTKSLYMSNFKRPLHTPSLRAHIAKVSGSSDPITFFYINNIRSHCFVTFNSESVASRVRAKMHNTKFPNEDLREKIFVDYVPDEKVEGWVEMETTSSRTGRNSNAKLEVVYIPHDGKQKAVFQDASMSNRNSRGSMSHIPDRPAAAPRSPIQQRPPPVQQRDPRDEGTGFSGLDELFNSTTAKPKLYFKKVPQNVIDDRVDMIKDLYPERGISGDPGMKRYTFEKDKRKEDWVDNGPEFGHGQKGQDRLLGVGTGGRGRGFGYKGRARGFRAGYHGDFRGGYRGDHRDDFRR